MTGSFDNWSKSVKLDPNGSVHEKEVTLPKTDEKILYKFVADGDWKHDHTGKTEQDDGGNVNNVLYPEDIKHPSSGEANISSVAPGASTTAMAGEQPLEKDQEPTNDLPGAFPETPAATYEPNEEQSFSVNPIPASEGAGNPVQLAPGEQVPDPSTINSNTVTSHVHDDPSLKDSPEDPEQTFGVAPIPATGGIGNPVHLEAGEKVPDPSTITGNTTTSNVRLDKDSYEKSDSGAPVLPAPLSPQSEKEAAGASIFGLGPQTSNMIPESSMGMGKDTPAPIDAGPTVSSVAPESTTAQLAGQQPLEERGAPAMVTESQQAAHFDPEASASPIAVQEKGEVEKELQSKVPEVPAAAESDGKDESENKSGIAGMAAGGAAAAGAAAAGTAYALSGKVHETTGKDPVSALPQSVQDSINSMNNKAGKNEPVTEEPAKENIASTASLPQQTAVGEDITVPAEEADHAQDTTTSVPEEVLTSQKEAHVDPEASASSKAVQEKTAVEKELMSKVPETDATGEPAPASSAALSSTAPAPLNEKSVSGAPQLEDPVSGVAALSMDEKPTEASKGLNASAEDPAIPPTVEKTLAPEAKTPMDSRDVSPMTRTGHEPAPLTATQDQPTVTTGTETSKAPAESTPTAGKPVGTPRRPGANENTTPGKRGSFIDRMKGTPDSQKTTDSAASGSGKSDKRKSFFGRLKDKLKQ